ncbi:hypothetical protein [Gymnodinialimonas hymeniacidonis]|uniref:hypothetical protein n=1 Tax=Gymnodinialimonas hymeniacidonis TaxID=3126508 RepID=UPI0034C5E6BF
MCGTLTGNTNKPVNTVTLEDFFREKARLYSAGNVAGSVRNVQVPMVAHVAGSTFAANRLDDVILALEIYRNNLLVESYVRTEITEFHETAAVDGKVQAFVRYRNVNDKGGEISSFDATFICRQTNGNGWVICEAESIPPVKERFLAGIALA